MDFKKLFGLKDFVKGIVREVLEEVTENAELRVEATRDGGKVVYSKKLG